MEYNQDGSITRELNKNGLKRAENLQKATQIVDDYCLENGLTFEERTVLVELATHSLMGIATEYSQFYDEIIEKINPAHFDELVHRFNDEIKPTAEFTDCMENYQNATNFAQNLPFEIEMEEELTFGQMVNDTKAHIESITDAELRSFVANYIDKSIELGMINETNIERVTSNLNALTQIKLLRENDIELGYGQNFYGYTDDTNKIFINSNDNHGGFDAMKFGEPFRREMYLYHELTHQAIKGSFLDDVSQGYARRLIEEYVVQNYAEDIYYSTHNVARPARSMIEPIDCHAGVVIVDTNLDYYGEFQPLCEKMIDLLYSTGTREQKIKHFTKDVFDNDYFTSIALNREEITQFFPDFDEIFSYNYYSFAEGLTAEQELAYKAKLDRTSEKLQEMQTNQIQNDYSLTK